MVLVALILTAVIVRVVVFCVMYYVEIMVWVFNSIISISILSILYTLFCLFSVCMNSHYLQFSGCVKRNKNLQDTVNVHIETITRNRFRAGMQEGVTVRRTPNRPRPHNTRANTDSTLRSFHVDILTSKKKNIFPLTCL